MMQRLYIYDNPDGSDARLLDIDDKTKITMSLASNLFRDVTKMTGNYTYTINLPRTTHNERAIFGSDTAARVVTFPYLGHFADYWRDGIELIHGAQAVLLSVGSTIQIALTWGCSDALKSLLASDATLNSLDDSALTPINWSGNPVADNVITAWATIYNAPSAAPVMYALYDCYRPNDNENEEAWLETNSLNSCPYIRPVVRMPWILSQIRSQYGVTLDFSAVASVVDFLAIPLTGDKGEYVGNADTLTLVTYISDPLGVYFEFISNDLISVFYPPMPTPTDKAYVASNRTIYFEFDCAGEVIYDLAPRVVSDAVLRITRYNSLNVEQDHIDVPFALGNVGGAYSEVVLNTQVVFNMLQDDYIKLYVYSVTLSTSELEQVASTLSGLGGNIYCRLSNNEGYTDTNTPVIVGFPYPVSQNLPNVKLSDLIRTLCVLTGTFPKQAQGDTIVFTTFDTLWNNMASAYDWTRRIIPAYETDRAEKTEFKVADFARHNLYLYQGEDNYEGQYDGDLVVDNATLNITRDVFKIPFAPSQVKETTRRARIPIYEINNVEDLQTQTPRPAPTYEAKSVKARILLLQQERRADGYLGSDTQATFDGLNMQTAIDNRYAALRTALSRSFVITESVRMSDTELKTFNETLPVYLAQYGAYFAVTDIKASDNGTASVTMFRLTGEIPTPPPSPTPEPVYDAKVEYLKGSGNQYINTGTSLSVGMSIDITAEITTNYTTTQILLGFGSLAGCWMGNVNNAQWGISSSIKTGTSSTKTDINVIFASETTELTINGTTLSRVRSGTPVGTLTIFTDTTYKCSAKVYGVTIKDSNSNIIKNLIPVRKNGVGYMYDTVSGTLFGNDGTGNFTYGNDI